MHTTGRIALLALLASQRAAVVTAVSGSGSTTRYWDCCKPSCSWPGKASVDHPVLSCDSNDNILSNQNAQNGCETGGSSFTCTDNVPWAVDSTLSYGFAATKLAGGDESTWCCACYQLTFSRDTPLAGKTMIVQSTNTGGDLGDNHFDLLIPGGGMGIFQDGCTREFGQPFPGTPYGGVGPSPGDGSGRAGCDGLPTQRLREGCYWYFDWLQGTANPPVEFKQIRCPEVLVQKSGCRRADDGEFPEPAVGGTGTGCTTSGCTTSTTSNGVTTPPTEPPQVAPVYGQCGGQGWTGPTVCAAGSSCQVQNQYYSQCLPGSAAVSSDWQTSTTTAGPTPSSAALYGQCGGQGWTGPTMCATGSSCQVQNQYYSQCLPN